MTPTAFVEFVGRTIVGEVDERPGFLRLTGCFAYEAAVASWRELQAALPPCVAAIAIRYAGTDNALEDDESDFTDTAFDLVVTKTEAPGELRLFYQESMAHLIDTGDCLVDHVRMADLDARGTFSTFRTRFAVWESEPPQVLAIAEVLPDPRAYTKDFSDGDVVPSDLRPWLLRSGPNLEGHAFRAWRLAACRRLMAAISDQVSGPAGQPAYHFAGPPSRVARLRADHIVASFPRLQEGATWVFGAATDADTRHLLLASEWARTWRPEAPVDFGAGSLESAKSAYSAYVKSGSKETLRALADLRKNVAEETQKISQRASDLAGAIWKDLAVAGVPFLVKVLPDSAKTAFPNATAVVALIAAAFLTFSFITQTWINNRFFERQEGSRRTWKEALAGALSADEITGISDEPIRESIRDYEKVRNAVGIVYLLLVGVVLVFALQAFEHPLLTPR